MTDKQEKTYELRVTHEPDEEGVYWARIFVNGIWNRSFNSEDRGQAIAAARRYVDWKQGAGDTEEVIDLTKPTRPTMTVAVVFGLHLGAVPRPLGAHVATDEGEVVWVDHRGREHRTEEAAVEVVYVHVPMKADDHAA